MNKTQSLKLISKAYSYLDVLNNQVMSPLRERLFRQCTEEERGHRHFKPDGVTCGLTVPQAAKLFCVLRIAQYLNGDRIPEPKEWLHIQPSCLTACALVAEYSQQIERSWLEAEIDVNEILKLDYAELNK